MFRELWGAAPRVAVFTTALLVPTVGLGQNTSTGPPIVEAEAGIVRISIVTGPTPQASSIDRAGVRPHSAQYTNQVTGLTAADVVRRALDANAEIAATRLEVARARAGVRQAGLRPNPTIEFEQTTGRFTGSAGDRETSVGVTLPLEVGGQRRARISLAEAELAATEAEVAEAERRLSADVLSKYVDALSALRELQTAERLLELDTSSVRIVEIRVVEGESAPLEANLLRVEVDRLRAQQLVAEGKLRAALHALGALTGAQPGNLPKLREELSAPFVVPPASEEEALRIALASRPDLRRARLNEAAARAGLRLALAEGRPSVDLTARYTSGRSLTDLPEPLVPVPDLDRTLSFGVAITIPVFNRNQGAKDAAEAAIRQAELRAGYAETQVRSEVASAFARVRAAREAVTVLEQGVLARSVENVRVIREAYELGEFPVTDLLAEQRVLAESQRAHTELLEEYFRALVDLQAAMGTSTQAPAADRPGPAGPSTTSADPPTAAGEGTARPSAATTREVPQ